MRRHALQLPSLGLSILLAGSLAVAPGCPGNTPADAGDDDDAGDPGDPLDEHGCDHMEYGPENPVTASMGMADAPMVMTGHMRTDITLPTGIDSHAGYVHVMPPEAGPTNFYFDVDTEVRFMDMAGAAITPAESGPLALCEQVATRMVVEAPAMGVMLFFPSSTGELVRMVARHPDDDGMHMHEDGGHHDEDGGEHHHDEDAGEHHDHDGGA